MTLRPLLVSLLLLPLAACTQPTDTGAAPDENGLYPAYTSVDGTLDIKPLRLRITHPVPLSTTPGYGEEFDVTGTGAQTFFISRVAYHDGSQGLGDWSIPTKIALQMQNEDICTILGAAGTGVYLPLKMGRLMQCAPFTNAEGQRVIAAIGYSDTFESVDHLGSMLIIPRDDDVIILNDIVAFPAFNAWLDAEVLVFEQEHPNDPNALWPPVSDDAQAFYERVTNQVGAMIAQPSEEVAKNMNELEEWTKRITLY